MVRHMIEVRRANNLVEKFNGLFLDITSRFDDKCDETLLNI
jgi:hypothetical protein